MNRTIILLVLVLGTLMAAVDSTIVLLALPQITQDLHADLFTSIWVLLAYLLVSAIFSTQMGRVGDIFGRARMFNLGFAIFTVASALCGLSDSVYVLILFRVIQGVGGAMMSANSGAIVADHFPPNLMGRAYGFTSLGWNIGALLGIVLGGSLTTFFGWQYIFYINVPIGIVALVLGIKNIKDVNKVPRKLDITGSLTLGVGLTLISYSSISMASAGSSLVSDVLLLLGLAFVGAFIFNETRVENPMIDLRAFKYRLLAYSLTANFMQGIGGMAITFLLIMYLQGVRGLSPLDASLVLLPGYVIASFLAPYMGRLTDRHGSRWLSTIGIGVIMLSVLLYYLILTPDTPYYLILLVAGVNGVGSGMFWPSNTSAIMSSAPKGYFGSISGLSRTLGGVGIILSYVVSLSVAAAAIPKSVAFEIFLGTSKLDGGLSSVFVTGLHLAFLISAVILGLGTVFSFMRGKDVRTGKMEELERPGQK
ncbi:MFS transporter [Metallosphaera tengchongensis]|uniref:MFS transporter n=1 Tax=Metallosphaera tengchongensis TaxID=1532350 RepID=A0A6N0NZK4_9CREN|nr:MFS transporter [Metallosphaera tengchongensis]QKR00788.1 MFS transporter [Metallosphaera tengchongensis]